MNKLAIITAFLGGIRNRYMQYQPDRTLATNWPWPDRLTAAMGSSSVIRPISLISRS